MNLKKHLIPALICSLFNLPVFATVASGSLTAQSCVLGNTCSIPGNDGGITYYVIKPENGTNYTCRFVSTTEKPLNVVVYGGKKFLLENGVEFYSANPELTVSFMGTFLNPMDITDVGQIKIRRVDENSSGYVTCYPEVNNNLK